MADLKPALVPDVGHADVPVIEVMIKVGDHVDAEQGLVTLESDKATMEVPAPFAGTVREVKLKVGDAVSEGAVIAMIEADAGGQAAASPASKTPAAAVPAGSMEPKSASTPAAPVTPEANAPVAPPRPAEADETAEPTPARRHMPEDLPDGDVHPTARPPFDAHIVMPGDVPYASPAIRAFARELGVDVAQVKGSGRGGRIQRDDVSAYVKHALASGARPQGGAVAGVGGLSLLPWPKIDFAKFGTVEEKPLSRIQKISGANLARNWAMIPHVTQHEDADITELEAFRKQLGAENKELKISPLVFQIKAVVAALKAFPQFNASLDDSGEKLVMKKYFHIGIAVDTPDGLVVPVIKNADNLTVRGIARAIDELAAKARDGKLSPDDLAGKTFTVSNPGKRGNLHGGAIISQPNVGILRIGEIKKRVVVVERDGEDTMAIHPVMYMSLSYDHRIVDGVNANGFLYRVSELLEEGSFEI